MRKLYFLTALLCGFAASAQFNLEHTYTAEAGITRVNLEYSGEKYYGFDYTTSLLNIYNADHTLWKAIPLVIPGNVIVTYIRSVTEAKFNPDTNIEVTYYSAYYVGSTVNYVANAMSENGTMILTSEGTNDIVLSEIDGLPTKIICNNKNDTSRVFGLSGNLEHFYPEGNALTRTKLENSGEKYYMIDKVANMMRLFNAGHTPWKTIALPKPTLSTYVSPSRIVTETLFNDDALLEVSYTYNNGGNNYEGKIINENGDVIFTSPNTSVLYIDHIEGHVDKLAARLVLPSPMTIHHSYYTLPAITHEHTFPTQTFRTAMETGEEKFFTWTPVDGNCVIYNSDYSVWKTINLPVPAGWELDYVPQISQHRVNSDDLVELTYGCRGQVSGVYQYQCRLINELSDTLLTVPNCVNLQMITPAGLTEDKMIGLMYITNSTYFGSVYGLNALSVDQFADNQQLLYPNPADNLLHIKADAPIATIEIYNPFGKLVRKADGFLTEIATADLSNGLYLIKITDSNHKTTSHKILIAH